MPTITPVDIEKKQFNRAFRGYNEEEVDEFLEKVMQDFTALYKENHLLKERIEILENSLKDYKQMEETLHNAIIVAQKTAQEVCLNAERERDVILQEARIKAGEIIAEAERRLAEKERQLIELKKEVNLFRTRFKTLVEAQVASLYEEFGDENP